MPLNYLILCHFGITVRYVLTRRVEKMVPLSRLTSIIMPHHGATSTLRPRSEKISTAEVGAKETSRSSDMRSWTAIKLLKHGLEKKIYRKKGWLFELLQKEGETLITSLLVIHVELEV
jgi:hypothetical protein